MSFAFNFLPPAVHVDDDDDNNNGDIQNRSTPEPIQVATSTIDNNTGNAPEITHPFIWKENLAVLLEERGKKDIVFQEVVLGRDSETDRVENADSEEEEIPLRRVCMEEYQQEVTPGIYEGGLQVWECSLDLVRYFRQHNLRLLLPQEDQNTIVLSTALELGCGHALPGCWLLREALQDYYKKVQPKEIAPTQAPFSVTFVDYNDYVLDDVTISNIIINTTDVLENGDVAQLAKQGIVHMGSGDWKDMSRQWVENGEGRRFDWIMAAETTYTTEAAKDTAELLLKHLTIETGIGWIASKRYYFGVGGGTDALLEAAQTLAERGDYENDLRIETVWVVDNGVGNIREILKVTCHKKR